MRAPDTQSTTNTTKHIAQKANQRMKQTHAHSERATKKKQYNQVQNNK